MSLRINLQNTPDPETVQRAPVRFRSGEHELEGLLFTPSPAPDPLPAVVVAGAWTTVKEQMAGTYARELARRGFAALTFDFAGWGASPGARPCCEDPVQKTADLRAAVAFLASRPEVDSARVSGLGVCASSGYMAAVAAQDPKVSKLALVAPWLHDPEMAQAIYGGEEQTRQLIAAGRAAVDASETKLIVAASTSDETALMYQAPYYTERERGLIEAYDNQFNLASWEPWLTYDGQAAADQLEVPTLIVCSEAAALPAGAHAFVKRTRASVTERWLDDVNQFDFYDRADVVTLAADAVATHFEGAQ